MHDHCLNLLERMICCSLQLTAWQPKNDFLGYEKCGVMTANHLHSDRFNDYHISKRLSC